MLFLLGTSAGSKVHQNITSGRTRWSINAGDILSILDDASQEIPTYVTVRHFTPAEKYRNFYFISFFQKSNDVIDLCPVIVVVDIGVKLDLF